MKTKHNRKKRKMNLLFLFAAIFLIIVLVVAGKFFCDRTKTKPQKTVKTTTKVAEKIPANETPTNQTNTTANNSATNNVEQNSLADLKMPILMYHYIRDYNDPSDQIGINLSVSPEDFAKQLDLIQSKGYTTVTFNDLLSGKIPAKPIILTFDDGYQDFYTAAYPELKKRNMTAVSFVISGKIGGDYMTTDEIKEVAADGIEIGDHTISHPDLTKISHDKAVSEIVDSKIALENITGKKITSFCYPSGKYNVDIENIVKNAGFSFAATTNSGITAFKNPLELNRYRVNNNTNISGDLK